MFGRDVLHRVITAWRRPQSNRSPPFTADPHVRKSITLSIYIEQPDWCPVCDLPSTSLLYATCAHCVQGASPCATETGFLNSYLLTVIALALDIVQLIKLSRKTVGVKNHLKNNSRLGVHNYSSTEAVCPTNVLYTELAIQSSGCCRIYKKVFF